MPSILAIYNNETLKYIISSPHLSQSMFKIFQKQVKPSKVTKVFEDFTQSGLTETNPN